MMDSSVTSILEKIRELQPKTLHGNELLSALNLDSLDIVTLIVEIDAVFGVTISPEQIAGCARIEDLANLVRNEKPWRSSAA
jgi:acyl carrier protein